VVSAAKDLPVKGLGRVGEARDDLGVRQRASAPELVERARRERRIRIAEQPLRVVVPLLGARERETSAPSAAAPIPTRTSAASIGW
jgi:hypothetical protein